MNQAPRYRLLDRDHAFDGWTDTTKAMGIEEVLTAPRSPWQNAYVERFSDPPDANASIRDRIGRDGTAAGAP